MAFVNTGRYLESCVSSVLHPGAMAVLFRLNGILIEALTRGDTPHLPIAVGRGPDRYSRQIFRPEHPSRDEC